MTPLWGLCEALCLCGKNLRSESSGSKKREAAGQVTRDVEREVEGRLNTCKVTNGAKVEKKNLLIMFKSI